MSYLLFTVTTESNKANLGGGLDILVKSSYLKILITIGNVQLFKINTLPTNVICKTL